MSFLSDSVTPYRLTATTGVEAAMNNSGKNNIPLSTQDVEEGRGIIELGKLASMSIITEGSAHFVVEDGNVIQCDPSYIVDIGGLEEELALQVLILMGYSDEDLDRYLESRQGSDVPS